MQSNSQNNVSSTAHSDAKRATNHQVEKRPQLERRRSGQNQRIGIHTQGTARVILFTLVDLP